MFLFFHFIFFFVGLCFDVPAFSFFLHFCLMSQAPALQANAQALEERLLERRKSAFSDTDLPLDGNESDSSDNKIRPPLTAQSSRHQRVGSYRPMMVRGGYFVDEVPQSVAKAVDRNDNNNDNESTSSDTDISSLQPDITIRQAKIAAPTNVNLTIADYTDDPNYDSGPSHRSVSQSPTQTVCVVHTD